MILYLAGPMTGVPEHNYPAFHEAAARWREAGLQVLNPAELEGPEPDHAALDLVPAEWYYTRDLREMLMQGVDAIAVLPGWEQSRGARGEVTVGRLLGWPVYDAMSDPHLPVPEVAPITLLDDYQDNALSTMAMDLEVVVHRATVGLGIAGEAGEVADLIKKEVGHGHPADPARIAKEVGDVLWYCATVASAYGYTLGEIARLNARKLHERYPEGFTTERSLNRAS